MRTVPFFQRIKRKRYIQAYLFIAPVVILFSVFRLYPSAQTFLFSFAKVSLIKRTAVFLGFANFQKMFQDAIVMKGLKNTFIYAVSIVPASMFIGLVLAFVFDNLKALKEVFKAIYFMPMVTSVVASAIVWQWMYNPKMGLLNGLLRIFGLPPRLWISSTHDSVFSVIIFSIWMKIGFSMVVYLAGLQSVPDSLYESAQIDGASRFTQFVKITIPLLAPITNFLLIYTSIRTLRIFDEVWIMTEGGPAHSSTVIVIRIFEEAFNNFKFGYASALAFFLFLLIIIITVVQYIVSKRYEVRY